MEDILLRFPHIGENIFKKLNRKNFCKSMEVSRSWNYFIKNESVLQKAYKVHKDNKTRIQEKIQSLTDEIENDFRKKILEETTPFHLAAERGELQVCQEIMENADDMNPTTLGGYGLTPLHKAAENGHLSVYQLISKSVDDKNPKDKFDVTPLHWAARNGHLSVCQFIVENVVDKNPKSDWWTGLDIRNGSTPLHEAAENGHLSVCQFILKNVDDKNPRTRLGRTPLHLAAKNGHISVFKLIAENVSDINIKDAFGRTPHYWATIGNFQGMKKFIEDAQNTLG